MNEATPEPRLRLAVLGDFDGIHTRRWLEVFIQRGHDVHAISFYPPARELPGVTLHVLSVERSRSPRTDASVPSPLEANRVPRRRSTAASLVPRNVMRLLHAWRYSRAGLRPLLDAIRPDVFHAHYAVEHGFYGSTAGFHPYVVSVWGSDLLLASHTLLGKIIARHALSRADLVTANDPSLARRASELGVPGERLAVVHLGIDRVFLDSGKRSVNLASAGAGPLTIISDRALEPLYNVNVVVQAFARLRERLPDARLTIAGDGSERNRLQALARELELGASVRFTGRVSPSELAEMLSHAHVYVSVPSSDSLALSTVEAMAAGCFPIVADLPSNEGWITAGVNGLVVPRRNVDALTDAFLRALDDEGMRRSATAPNRAKVEAEGLRERNMLSMERRYYRLAGHPQGGSGEGI